MLMANDPSGAGRKLPTLQKMLLPMDGHYPLPHTVHPKSESAYHSKEEISQGSKLPSPLPLPVHAHSMICGNRHHSHLLPPGAHFG